MADDDFTEIPDMESDGHITTQSLVLAKHLEGTKHEFGYVYGPYPIAGTLKISSRTSG